MCSGIALPRPISPYREGRSPGSACEPDGAAADLKSCRLCLWFAPATIPLISVLAVLSRAQPGRIPFTMIKSMRVVLCRTLLGVLDDRRVTIFAVSARQPAFPCPNCAGSANSVHPSIRNRREAHRLGDEDAHRHKAEVTRPDQFCRPNPRQRAPRSLDEQYCGRRGSVPPVKQRRDFRYVISPWDEPVDHKRCFPGDMAVNDDLDQ